MRLAITFVLILAGGAAAQENPALPVVKAAIEAHGGAEALKKIRTARLTSSGTMTFNGHEIKIAATAVYALPDKFRMELASDIGGTKQTNTYILNGKKTRLVAKLNGTETPVDPQAKNELVQAVLLQDATSLTPLLEPKKYTLKLEKDAEINGNLASVVLVNGNGLKDVLLFFDRKSNRLVKTQRRTSAAGVEVNEEQYLSDFKPFEKALLPTATVMNHDGKKFMTMTVTEMKFLDKIDDKEFAIE